jgi:hypothetical protein
MEILIALCVYAAFTIIIAACISVYYPICYIQNYEKGSCIISLILYTLIWPIVIIVLIGRNCMKSEIQPVNSTSNSIIGV